MKPVESTAEILAWKHLNRDIDNHWVEWAVDMMCAGFDNEHLVELAGMTEPFNQFEMHDITDKVLSELKLDFKDKKRVMDNYVFYLIRETLAQKRDILTTLNFIKDLHIDLEMETEYHHFYLLYFAKSDLMEYEVQWYWDGATKANIDQICLEEFNKWIKEHNEII